VIILITKSGIEKYDFTIKSYIRDKKLSTTGNDSVK